MATNQPKPLLSARFIDWVTALPPRSPHIWCDECHYWHNDINECAYVTPRVGA